METRKTKKQTNKKKKTATTKGKYSYLNRLHDKKFTSQRRKEDSLSPLLTLRFDHCRLGLYCTKASLLSHYSQAKEQWVW